MSIRHLYVAVVLSMVALLAPAATATAAEPTTPSVSGEVGAAGGLAGRVDLSALSEASRGCVGVAAYVRGPKGWTGAAQAQVSSDGSYALHGLATATYRLGFTDTCIVLDDRVTAATQFFPDALEIGDAADLAVVDGADTTVRPFVIAPAGHLSGYLYVYDRARRTSVDDARVQLFRKSVNGWQVVAEEQTAEMGGYRFDSIPAGDYRIGFAKGDKELREVFHPSALTLAQAHTVTVAPRPRWAPTHLREAVTWRRDAKIVMTHTPDLRGKARVGRTLRTLHSSYAQHDVVTVRHQWQLRRNGKVRNISGATAKRVELKRRHRGAQVRLRIIATAQGHQRHVHRTVWSAPVRRR